MLSTTPLSAFAMFSLAFTFCFPQPVKADEPVKVGIISGLTGVCGPVCPGAAKAIQLACEDWNSTSTPKVNCIVEDDGTDPKKGVSAYLTLRDKHRVDALMNITSGTIQAIASQVRAQGIPTMQVFLEGAAPQRDNIFQICPELDTAEEALGKLVAERYTGKVVVFSSDLDAVTRLVTAFRRGFEREIIQVNFPLDVAHERSGILRAMNQQPDAVVFITLPVHTQMVEKELRLLRSDVPRVFDANFLSGLSELQETLKDLSNLHSSPVLVMKMGEQSRRAKLAARYKERFGTETAPYWEYSYDALMVLMKAYDPVPATWIAALEQTKYSGYSGEIEFDSAGTTKPAFEIITVGELIERERR